jgi:hypothetical protein
MSNRPSHELFSISEHPACSRERILSAGEERQTWRKAGIAFTTTDSNLNVYIDDGGTTAKSTRYFVSCSNRRIAQNDRRIPIGNVFAPASDGAIDINNNKVGIAFLNDNDSYTIIVGVRGEPIPRRYVLQPVKPISTSTTAQNTDVERTHAA